MVVVMSVRPIFARAIAGDGAGAGSVACVGWKCMAEEKHATPGGCQALRRNKANDFRWMQLKPIHFLRPYRHPFLIAVLQLNRIGSILPLMHFHVCCPCFRAFRVGVIARTAFRARAQGDGPEKDAVLHEDGDNRVVLCSSQFALRICVVVGAPYHDGQSSTLRRHCFRADAKDLTAGVRLSIDDKRAQIDDTCLVTTPGMLRLIRKDHAGPLGCAMKSDVGTVCLRLCDRRVHGSRVNDLSENACKQAKAPTPHARSRAGWNHCWSGISILHASFQEWVVRAVWRATTRLDIGLFRKPCLRTPTTTQASVEPAADARRIAPRSWTAHAWADLLDCAILGITDGPVAQLDRAVPS